MGNQATCPSPGGGVYEIGGGEQRERWLSMALGRDSISAAAAVRMVVVEALANENDEQQHSIVMQKSS